jgi:hypothetical protein
LDRGTKEADIILRFRELARQAAEAQGKIISLVGNHEILNYEANFSYANGDWGDGYMSFQVNNSCFKFCRPPSNFILPLITL